MGASLSEFNESGLSLNPQIHHARESGYPSFSAASVIPAYAGMTESECPQVNQRLTLKTNPSPLNGINQICAHPDTAAIGFKHQFFTEPIFDVKGIDRIEQTHAIAHIQLWG